MQERGRILEKTTLNLTFQPQLQQETAAKLKPGLQFLSTAGKIKTLNELTNNANTYAVMFWPLGYAGRLRGRKSTTAEELQRIVNVLETEDAKG